MPMPSLIVPLMVTTAASLLATPLARLLAWRWEALDHADGLRKLHAGPVPHLGGVALFAALAVGVLTCCSDNLFDSLTLPLLLSAGMMCLVGWLDDRQGLRVRWKLLGQVLATLPLILSGHAIDRIEFGGYIVDLGWWTIPLSIGWYVAGANALNFIDGADGLAATIGLVAAAAAALVADQLGHPEAAMLAVILAGGLCGFLLHNWQPATIYLGDAGSMTVGLWLAAVVAEGSRAPQLGSRLVVLVALLAVPLADVTLAVIRRLLSGKQFWLADRAHLHHRLLARGLSVPQVVGILAGFAAAAGLIGYVAAVHGRELVAWFSLSLLVAAALRFDLAGAPEMELMSELAARRLLGTLSRLSAGRGLRKYPRPAEIGKLSLPTAWAMFLAEMQIHLVEDLDLTIEGGGANRWRYQWKGSPAPADEVVLWSIDIAFQGPAGERCRLHAATREGAATAPLNWLALSDRLRIYAEHWAKHAHELDGALLRETSRGLTIAPASGDDLAKAA